MPEISLTEPLEHCVESQIKAGRFADISEAVRAGLWLLLKEHRGAERFYELRAELTDLAERALAGEGEPFDMEEFERERRMAAE